MDACVGIPKPRLTSWPSFTNAVLGDRYLPAVETFPAVEHFDYEAKYQGLSREVCPAQIPDDLRDRIQDVSKKIYSHLGCAGLVRVDYICSGDDLYFLEVNTIPGMTSASLVPQMVRAAGMNMTDFLTTIIENSQVG